MNTRPNTRRNTDANTDSAGALLSSILDDTAAEAHAEEAAQARQLDMRLQAQRATKARQEAAKRDAITQRLQAQRDHQDAARQTRASLVRAFDGPSLEEERAQQRAAAEAERAADLERKLAAAEHARLEAERRAAEAERDERAKREAADARLREAAAAQRTHTWRSRIAAGAFALVALGAVGLGVAWTAQNGPDQQLLQTTYAKTTLTASAVASPTIDYGFKRIPTAAPDGAEGDTVATDTKNTKRRPWRKRNGVVNNGTTQPNFDFNGSGDIFKKGP